MWQRMLARIEELRAGTISLHQLVDDLRGLYVEADPHDSRVRDDVEHHWSALEIEHAQRSEPWMPGVATDESLRVAAGQFESWVMTVLDEAVLGEHG
jgi:hypothetical protein